MNQLQGITQVFALAVGVQAQLLIVAQAFEQRTELFAEVHRCPLLGRRVPGWLGQQGVDEVEFGLGQKRVVGHDGDCVRGTLSRP